MGAPFDDFDTQVQCDEYDEAMEGYDSWFEELCIADILINDDQWEDFI